MLAALLSMCLSFVLVVRCGGQSSAVKSSPTPQIAPSVAATSLPDPATSSVLQARIISIFLIDPMRPKQRAQLANQIARMSGVQESAFVFKKPALQRFKKRLGKNDSIVVVGLPTNPLPASFEIVVKTRSDVLPVARRFFNDPLVDNDPGTHDGVAFARYPAIP
jgi:hypothetical protein